MSTHICMTLSIAINNKHNNCIKMLLANGVNVDEIQDDGWTPLNSASALGYSKCVKTLLAGEADVNVKNSIGHTPLHHASMNGHYDCIMMLLDHNANINAKDWMGNIPLHLITPISRNRNCIKLLVNKGANIYEENINKLSPINAPMMCADIKDIYIKYLNDNEPIKEPVDDY